MRRISLVVGVIISAAMLADQVGAQSPPNFSGKWTLVPNAASPTYPPGGTVTIAQDMTTLTIESTGFRFRASTKGTWSETPFATRVTYILDGLEHPRQVVADPLPPAAPPASTMVMKSTMEESLAKATWAGRQLVIMTYDKERTIAPRMTPSESVRRRTIRDAISLEADGTLIWETLIVADPSPWGHEASTPTPSRRVYKKV